MRPELLALIEGVTDIPITQITLPKTLLRLVDTQSVEYLELTDSVRAHGVLHPILVRKRNGRWEIIDGLHRFTASREVGLETVPCKVIEATDEEAMLLTIQLNAVTKETLPCEYASVLRQYLKLNPDLTIAGLSRRVNKSPAWIAGCLSLTYLSEQMQTMVNRGEMPLQSAYLLAKIPKHWRDRFVDHARVLTSREFRPMAIDAIRQWHDSVRQGRLERSYPDTFKARTYLKTLSEIRHEHDVEEAAMRAILGKDLKTALEGWRAAILWVLHIDDAGLLEQRRRFSRYSRGDLCDPTPESDPS